MASTVSRRHVLRILGAGTVLGAGIYGLRSLRDAPRPIQWNGEVLGALSAMTLWHPNQRVAERTIARMLVEISRLDRIFSLYRQDSELTQLNRSGRIGQPSGDLVAVFEESLRIASISDGAFDPTVQPLWRLQAADGHEPAMVERALTLVDYNAVDVSKSRIAFGRPQMAATLNGIAQGYITDRITDLLANDGFEQAMIELGETRALGSAPDGAPFTVDIVDPAAPGSIASRLPLAGAALAVSGGYGLRFNASGEHHILDPATGRSPRSLRQVAVISPRAVWADALSTAITVAGEAAARELLAHYRDSRAILWRADGTVDEV